MDCNNGSILSKIEMTNYSKLRVELWSISYCGHSDAVASPRPVQYLRHLATSW